MIAFAFAATVINYLDRQALSVAAPVLREEFGMTNTDYSRVVFAFMLAYTVMNGVSGTLIDRLGTRAGYALCMAWWSAAAILHAFARGFWSLGAFRFLLGMGEAGNWPAAVKVVAEWFPPHERAMAGGLFNAGSAVGAILAPPVMAWLLLHRGWPSAFWLVGLSGFAWLLAWWPVYRTPAAVDTMRRGAASVPAARLFRHRFVWSFTLSKVFMDPVWYFYTFWFPEYLKQARQFDMASIGRYAWIPYLVASFGNLLGGWVGGWLLRRGLDTTRARKLAVTIFAGLMLAAIPAALTPDVRWSITFVSVAMLGYTGATANMLAMPADVIPGRAVATVYGLASMGAGFGGMIFALATGWAVDRFSFTPVFFGFGLMPLMCSAIQWTLCGPLRLAPEFDETPLVEVR